MKKSPSAAEFDTLEDTSGFARPIDDFGETEISQDHVGNLENLHEMLVRKRRYLAQDVRAYPPVFIGRAQDIHRIQELIEALDRALVHERSLVN